MGWLQSLHRRWRTRRNPLTEAVWAEALSACRYARQLPPPDQQRLHDLTARFLRIKTFTGAGGLELTTAMSALIAIRACLPILNLGLDYYNEWVGIVVYPGDFRAHHEVMSEDGVVHQGWRELCGESLERGPLVLSWQTLAADPDYEGCDLVIHECAHKLDILNGSANGYPPLHAGMSTAAWSQAFAEAFGRINDQLNQGMETTLDPYAASDPAEYFSVASEAFFTAPWLLTGAEPAVYEALSVFYRQDPASVLPAG